MIFTGVEYLIAASKPINIYQTNSIDVSADEYERLKKEMKDLKAEQKSVQKSKQAKKEVQALLNWKECASFDAWFPGSMVVSHKWVNLLPVQIAAHNMTVIREEWESKQMLQENTIKKLKAQLSDTCQRSTKLREYYAK